MADHSRSKLNSPASSTSGTANPATGEGSAEGDSQSRSRRRFIKAGLIGVPMVVTLRSRPAHALTSLGSATIFYGAYREFQNPDGTTRWAPVDQDGNEMQDPTRRTPNPSGQSDDVPELDTWSPEPPPLDTWSP